MAWDEKKHIKRLKLRKHFLEALQKLHKRNEKKSFYWNLISTSVEMCNDFNLSFDNKSCRINYCKERQKHFVSLFAVSWMGWSDENALQLGVIMKMKRKSHSAPSARLWFQSSQRRTTLSGWEGETFPPQTADDKKVLMFRYLRTNHCQLHTWTLTWLSIKEVLGRDRQSGCFKIRIRKLMAHKET